MPKAPDRDQTPFSVQVALGSQHRWRFYREVTLGVRQYGFKTASLVVGDSWPDSAWQGDLGPLVRASGVQGIVTALHTPEEESRYAALSIPVVNVSSAVSEPRLPLVSQDDESVGQLAATHLLACGCRAFGFWGRQGGNYSEQRHRGFAAALAAAGQAGKIHVAESREQGWSQEKIQAWLRELPRPAGIFAVHDNLAASVIRAALALGWRVPGDVAVIGAGNDDFWVEYESVTLSSVSLPSRQIGYEAAALLHRLMTGRETAPKPVRVPVREIAVRRSTDILHVDDPAVARAIVHIRTHATLNPYVSEIARVSGVSLTALQARFRRVLGRSLTEEITRVRLVRAQELLADTDLPMSVIAERCGFSNSQLFSVRFRQGAGVTPSGYRRRFRAL